VTSDVETGPYTILKQAVGIAGYNDFRALMDPSR